MKNRARPVEEATLDLRREMKVIRNLLSRFVVGFVVLVVISASAQQSRVSHEKVLTPAQAAYQEQWKEYMAKRKQLQAQAAQIFQVEMGREKTGDCPNANSTYEFNACFGDVLKTTKQNLEKYEKAIRQLIAPGPPQIGDHPTTGMAGPIFTPDQLLRQFNDVEQSWEHYRKTACTAAFHQFGGGTGGPSFELQCEIMVGRNHMRELNVIYGNDLRL